MGSNSRLGRKRPRRVGTHVIVTDPATSERMRRVRRHDTAPELLVQRCLRTSGHRYRKRNRDLPGSPDLANRSKRWAIFVHGCFWHGHQGCKRATIPKSNTDFWTKKIADNRARDARNEHDLRALGFKVLVLWECEAEQLGINESGTNLLSTLLRPSQQEEP
jgi:DNA mismatch endonuclease Vsr